MTVQKLPHLRYPVADKLAGDNFYILEKWLNDQIVEAPPTPSGSFTVQRDTYLDGTGISITPGNSDFLPWVDAGGAPWLPNDNILLPGTYGGAVGAKVVADGLFIFKMTVDQVIGSGGGSGLAALQIILDRAPTNLDIGASAFPVAGPPPDSSAECSMAFPCLANDIIYARVQASATSDTNVYKLFASVQSLT